MLLVLKALGHLEIFVKPVSSHLPHSIAHPRVIGILVLIGLCFLVGALIQTAIGRNAERAAERAVLEKIPGYTVLRSLASRISDHDADAVGQIEDVMAAASAVIIWKHRPNIQRLMAGTERRFRQKKT